MGDKRRTDRLIHVAAELSANTGSSLASSCADDSAALLGGYRFIENKAVKPDDIAKSGFQSTAVLSQESNLLLAIEDSTTLSYKHSIVSELGGLGGPKDSTAKGFWVHSVMLMDANLERTVGLIDQQRWIRLGKSESEKVSTRKRPYEEKESFKWQKSSENISQRLGDQIAITISVCDREADVFEYIQYKIDNGERFVVRASQNRRLVDEDKCLFDAVLETPVIGEYTIKIPQRGGRKAREAKLEVRSKRVTILPPQRPDSQLSPLSVNVVIAQEVGADSDEKLCWILLTSENIETFECCRKILRFYELRWGIEEFHKAWKSGAKVEEQRMQSAGNMERIAVILMFIAVRLIQLREALMKPFSANLESGQKGNENAGNENTPANKVVSAEEWQVLWFLKEKKTLPDKPPSLLWFFQTLAKLGGWYDSKRTGRPGWLAIWKGCMKLQLVIEGYRVGHQFYSREM